MILKVYFLQLKVTYFNCSLYGIKYVRVSFCVYSTGVEQIEKTSKDNLTELTDFQEKYNKAVNRRQLLLQNDNETDSESFATLQNMIATAKNSTTLKQLLMNHRYWNNSIEMFPMWPFWIIAKIGY